MKKKTSKVKKKIVPISLDSKVDNLSGLVESLAASTAKGFDSVNQRFDKIERNLDELNHNIKATRRDMLNMGDKFVTYRKFDELALRVAKLEKNKK